jgi:hypothetical protein
MEQLGSHWTDFDKTYYLHSAECRDDPGALIVWISRKPHFARHTQAVISRIYFSTALPSLDEQNNNKMQQLTKYDTKYQIPLCNRNHKSSITAEVLYSA